MQPAQKFHIIPFVASLSICLFAGDLSADTPLIRVSVHSASPDNGADARMLSALSHEFRKLDGVSVTDTQPALKISCGVIKIPTAERETRRIAGYASSVAITSIDDRFITHFVFTDNTIDSLARRIAIAVDAGVIEPMRRNAQPSSSP
jgi:hypothetical protein